jgi:hypothetical protein
MTHPSFWEKIEKHAMLGICFWFLTVAIFPAEVFVMKRMVCTAESLSVRGAKIPSLCSCGEKVSRDLLETMLVEGICSRVGTEGRFSPLGWVTGRGYCISKEKLGSLVSNGGGWWK